MLVTNNTSSDYWFGPLHLPGGNGQTLLVDDTSEMSLYLTSDEVADALNNLQAAGKISVSGQALPFPRATGTPQMLHGDGSPEGGVYAAQGSIYLRRDSTLAANSLYSKLTGVATSTGWWAVGTAGAFAVGSSFPAAPAVGDGFVLNAGNTFIAFVYDGTHWYSPPVPSVLLANGANPLTTQNTSVTELVDGGLLAITDAITAGCTVQLRVEGFFSNAYTGTPGDLSFDGHLQAGYYTAASGGILTGPSWVSGTVVTTGNPNYQQFYYLASSWGAGPTTGDSIIPIAGGYRDGGGSGYTITYNAITVWVRFMK